MIVDYDLCFFIQSVSDWNLPQIKFRILQKLVSFLCSFQGAMSTALRLTEWRVESGVWRFSLLPLRFPLLLLEVSLRTLKTIQTRDSVRRLGSLSLASAILSVLQPDSVFRLPLACRFRLIRDRSKSLRLFSSPLSTLHSPLFSQPST